MLCGPAGAGKTTIAESIVGVQRPTAIGWHGDLSSPEQMTSALERAASETVLAVVRSGESFALRHRWSDMGLSQSLVDAASVVTVTLRRFAARGALVVEVLAPDGGALTGSLADEAHALVLAGRISADEAAFMVPGYG